VAVAALRFDQLMRVSERAVGQAVRSNQPRLQLVASRVVESTVSWQRWESEHAVIMRRIVAPRRPPAQVSALKTAAFGLIHRKALFEYLSERSLSRVQRRRIISLFHGARGYTDSMIAEHGNYIRSACSYVCTGEVGSQVVQDGAFQDPMDRYEELYTEYFHAYCDSEVGSLDDPGTAGLRAILPLLKLQLVEQRKAILAMPRSMPDLLREARLRTPTGTTQKLRRPDFVEGAG